MVQGIQKNDLLTISDTQMATILPAFKLDKQPIAKNLLKSLYWALTLGNSKYFHHFIKLFDILDPLVLSALNAKELAKVGEQYI